MKHTDTGLLLIGATILLTIAGCGGGNGSGIINSTPTPTTRPTTTPTAVATATPIPVGVARFAGNYTGAYVTIGSASGADITGTFSSTATNGGAISGEVKQDNGPTTTATGTVSSSGVFHASASGSVVVPSSDSAVRNTAVAAPTATPGPVTISYSTKLDGTATLSGDDSVLAGIVLTTQSNNNNPRGRFVGIRNMTTPSAFAGTYSGSFNGTITRGNVPLKGSLAFTANANGLLRGTFSREPENGTNFRVRPLVGTIDKAGNAQLVTLTEVEDPTGSGNFVLVINTLAGRGTATSSTKISGTLNRTGSPLANGTATFTATRTSTSTN